MVTCFNPLAIGSNVLIGAKPAPNEWARQFQSPSNRVKCSDFVDGQRKANEDFGFNPLAIGSNVLILLQNEFTGIVKLSFNPLAIGSNVLIAVSAFAQEDPTSSFNPLAIGSNVLIGGDYENHDKGALCFNPLAIGSNVLIEQLDYNANVGNSFNPLAIGSNVLMSDQRMQRTRLPRVSIP